MSFFSVAIKMPKDITITFLVNIVSQIKVMVMMALTHLGMYKPPEEDYSWEHNHLTNYILMLDGSSPSLIPIPVHIVTASIKKRLEVIPYGHLIEKTSAIHQEYEDNKACAVCLDCIESSHEIRVLCNCCHVFHRECLDNWVDEGQVTCPLCRSMLLPPDGNLNLLRCGGGGGGGGGDGGGGDPWMMERNAQLFAEDEGRRTT